MNLYIPVEIKTRELEAKLLVAFEAANNNFKVILGPKDKIIKKMPYLKRGIVLWSFGNVKNYKSVFKYIKNSGHKIATIDEEGLVFLNREIYSKYRISAEAIKNVDICFAWGDIHKEAMIYRTPEIEDKIVMIGNPRFDLLKPELRTISVDDVNMIKRAYSPFILVNTNFPFYNHYYGKDYFYPFLEKVFMIKDTSDKVFWKNWIDYQEKLFKEFLILIPKLSKAFKNNKIIVRPHPSENHKVWKKISKDLKNVSIISDGNVISWIMASEAVIHNGCTTAVEAFVLDIPIIAHQPFASDLFGNILPNQLSHKVKNFNELQSCLRELLLTYKKNSLEDKSKLNKYIFSNNKGLAKDRIVKTLKEIEIKDVDGVKKYLVFRNYYKIRQSIGRILRIALRKGRTSEDYIQHKFPELKNDEILNFLLKLKRVTGKYQDIVFENIGDACFEITSSRK